MEKATLLSLKDLKKVTGGTGNESVVGMNCVKCGTFIPIDLMQLINSNFFECPSCHERYSLDKTSSVKAEEMLRKVQEAIESKGR